MLKAVLNARRHLGLVSFPQRSTAEPWVVEKRAALADPGLGRLLGYLARIPDVHAMTVEQAERVLVVPLDAAAQARFPVERLVPAITQLVGSAAGRHAHCAEVLTADALDTLGAAAQHAREQRAAGAWQALRDDPSLPERTDQTWFEAHPWIVGTEYVRRSEAPPIALQSQADSLLVSVEPLLGEPKGNVLHPDAEQLGQAQDGALPWHPLPALPG